MADEKTIIIDEDWKSEVQAENDRALKAKPSAAATSGDSAEVIDPQMFSFVPRSELEVIKRDAYSSEGKTFTERTAMFLSIMEMVEAMQSHLSPEEHARRLHIADQLDPRPDPWWRNFRKEALAEYQCGTSSI